MNKIIKADEVTSLVSGLKNSGKKIVLAGGCFDILHLGHVAFLENAKKTGDVLILLLESDEAIKKLKGDKRPVNSQDSRAKILSAIEFVDFVIILKKPLKTHDYNILVKDISPDVIAVTEGDPNFENKKTQARESGGVVKVVLEKLHEHSTTKLVEFV